MAESVAFQPHVPECAIPIEIEGVGNDTPARYHEARHPPFRGWQSPEVAVLGVDLQIAAVVVPPQGYILVPYAGFHSGVYPRRTAPVSTMG